VIFEELLIQDGRRGHFYIFWIGVNGVMNWCLWIWCFRTCKT